MPNSHAPLIERFEASYIPEPNSGCWIWIASTDVDKDAQKQMQPPAGETIRATQDGSMEAARHPIAQCMVDAGLSHVKPSDHVRALEERLARHSDYSIDLARIIEDLCNSREIREPTTNARFHYDMAVAYRSKAIAKAEAAS